ncbi:unnamed protein product [Closterium sp. Naga37s-1]|nr:unnamed protein product [Closterium sp. Naga37s-1]
MAIWIPHGFFCGCAPTLTHLLTRYPAPSSLPHPLLPPLEHARLHLIPPFTPAPPFSPSSPLPLLLPPRRPPSRGAIRAVPRHRELPELSKARLHLAPPVPLSPSPPPAAAPSARYLAVGNLWEQLSKARLHLAEAMALARHWGRTLVLPRVRSSRIGGNNPPRGMLCFPRARSLTRCDDRAWLRWVPPRAELAVLVQFTHPHRVPATAVSLHLLFSRLSLVRSLPKLVHAVPGTLSQILGVRGGGA